jgi:hypothetical protein
LEIDLFGDSVPFDPKLVEARLALKRIGPDEMPALAWDALEAGLDGPCIRKLAALTNPSGWETDQILPSFMAEAGLKPITRREASVRLARESVICVTQKALDGQTGVIDAARTLLPLLRRSPELTSEEDFNLVRAIDSETDDLPLGRVREYWDPVVLASKDREIARCESLWRDQLRAVCERIIERLHDLP